MFCIHLRHLLSLKPSSAVLLPYCSAAKSGSFNPPTSPASAAQLSIPPSLWLNYSVASHWPPCLHALPVQDIFRASCTAMRGVVAKYRRFVHHANNLFPRSFWWIPMNYLRNLTQNLIVAFKLLHDPLVSYLSNLISHYAPDTSGQPPDHTPNTLYGQVSLERSSPTHPLHPSRFHSKFTHPSISIQNHFLYLSNKIAWVLLYVSNQINH